MNSGKHPEVHLHNYQTSSETEARLMAKDFVSSRSPFAEDVC